MARRDQKEASRSTRRLWSPPPHFCGVGGGGRVLARPGVAGLRETGQGMWERCDLGVSRPGVSIAHYARDFGSHLTSALHSFTAMHRGDRACPPPKGFGTFKWVHAGENPSSSWHIRRLSFLPAPSSPAAATWVEGPDPPLLPVPAQLLIGFSLTTLLNSDRLLSSTCLGQTWEWDSRPDQSRRLPSGAPCPEWETDPGVC